MNILETVQSFQSCILGHYVNHQDQLHLAIFLQSRQNVNLTKMNQTTFSNAIHIILYLFPPKTPALLPTYQNFRHLTSYTVYACRQMPFVAFPNGCLSLLAVMLPAALQSLSFSCLSLLHFPFYLQYTSIFTQQRSNKARTQEHQVFVIHLSSQWVVLMF